MEYGRSLPTREGRAYETHILADYYPAGRGARDLRPGDLQIQNRRFSWLELQSSTQHQSAGRYRWLVQFPDGRRAWLPPPEWRFPADRLSGSDFYQCSGNQICTAQRR